MASRGHVKRGRGHLGWIMIEAEISQISEKFLPMLRKNLTQYTSLYMLKVLRKTAMSPQSTFYLSTAGEGSSGVARLMSLPRIMFCLSWEDTVTAAGDTKHLPKTWAGTAVNRLKCEVVDMELIS